MDINQSEQNKIWVSTRQERPKYGYETERTDQKTGIAQTEQTEIWVLARLNRPKYRYYPDQTDQNRGA